MVFRSRLTPLCKAGSVGRRNAVLLRHSPNKKNGPGHLRGSRHRPHLEVTEHGHGTASNYRRKLSAKAIVRNQPANALIAVSLDRWRKARTSPRTCSHAADLRTGFVAVGPHVIALYGTEREPLWVFQLPTSEQLCEGGATFGFRSDEEPTPEQFSSFALAGTCASAASVRITSLRSTYKRGVWRGYSTPAEEAVTKPGTQSSGAPCTVWSALRRAELEKFVVLQLSDGRRWFVELATGKPVVQRHLDERTRASLVAAPSCSCE